MPTKKIFILKRYLKVQHESSSLMYKFNYFRILFFLYFSIVNVWVVNSQEIDESQIQQYSVSQGLSLSYTTSIFQDKNGFIWVGTQDGLNRFDGFRFKSYRHNALDSSSISGNYIRSINQDKEGVFWIVSENSVMRYNQLNSVFKVVLDKRNAEFETASKVIIDDEFVWVNSVKGLFRINKKTFDLRYFEHYSDPFNYNCSYCVNDMIEVDGDKLLIASKDGLFLFNKKSESFINYNPKNKTNNLKSYSVLSLKLMDKDNVLIGSDRGLQLFSLRNNSFQYFEYHSNNKREYDYKNNIKTIERDKEGFYWLGTKMGLMIFDPIKREIRNPQEKNSSLWGMQNAEITDILLDRTNSLWISTAGQNLFRISRIKPFFGKYKNLSNQKLEGVRAIFKDINQKLWVGTSHSGIYIFNKNNNLESHIHPENSDLESYSVYCFLQLKNQDIYIGTSNGLFIYNSNRKVLNNYTLMFPSIPEFLFQRNKIYSILSDKKEGVWLATENGLIYLFRNKYKFFFHNKKEPESLSNTICYSLEFDSDSNLWVGTLNGLNKLVDSKKGRFQHFFESNEISKGLPNNSVLCIKKAINDDLWVGTEGGLSCYNLKSNSFVNYTVEANLLNDYVYSLFLDSKERVWFSTNNGVSRLNPKTKEIYNFSKSDGLQSYEFNLGAGFKSKDGIIYFGGDSGLNFFNPDSIFVNERVPLVKINSIIVTQNGVQKEIIADNQKEFDFFYKGLHLQISFLIPDYNSVENNSYQYRMLGVDPNWINIGSKNTVSFTQLPVGDYIFHVKGANNHGIWNERFTSIKIKIKPGIYNSKFAIGLYFLIGIFFILLAVFFITSKLRKENYLLKQKEIDAKKIAFQKEELMQQNLNMRSSMEYAQRIIYAMMPSVEDFKQILPDSFIIYSPKDIVSGDFYWITQRDGLIFFAVVDCTGHGIPGAFMSIIGFDLLRNIVNKQNFTDPGEILKRLSMDLVDVLTKDNTSDDDSLQDGMDMSICVLNQNNNTLKYAGAYNPMYLIRENNLIEYKADRHSVGASGIAAGHKFSTKIIQLQANDVIYLFSDGYTDQFGGPQNKKFKFRRFRHLLLSVHKHQIDLQEKAIRNAHEAWKMGEEQVDDILVVGIKPYKF